MKKLPGLAGQIQAMLEQMPARALAFLESPIRRVPAGRDASAARDRYFDLEREYRRPQWVLAVSSLPGDRADALRLMFELQQEQADLHRTAFGPDPIPWEDGRDLADSHALSAHLLYLAWQAEVALVDHVETDWARLGKVEFAAVSAAAAPVLARLYRDRPVDRLARYEDLWQAVVDLVGGQAAEVVACLPAPDVVA
jgi:hypothetical protein